MGFVEFLTAHLLPFLTGVLAGGLVALVAVVLIRALRFRPVAGEAQNFADVTVDTARATECLAALVRCKTVSYRDASKEDDAEFEKLIGLLPELYPNVAKTCAFQRFSDRAILYRWQGKSADAPTVLMAHYDVVPVNEELWEKPPFDGVLEDGVLWGRGTLDTKVTMNAALFATNTLIAEGFVPEQDIYFAFSGGEEINGKGARNIVEYFKENGGWRDHYHFQELMPWYYTAAIILALTFIISISLMAIHNHSHHRDKTATEKYYQTADEYALPTIEDAIEKLAKENKRYDAGGEIIVPRRIIKFLEKKYQSGKSLSYLCNVYLNEYLK